MVFLVFLGGKYPGIRRSYGNSIFNFFLKKDFIYLFDRDRDSQREREHKQGEWERKQQAPAEEPDAGLDSRTPGSRPEPKADAQ